MMSDTSVGLLLIYGGKLITGFLVSLSRILQDVPNWSELEVNNSELYVFLQAFTPGETQINDTKK